MEEKIDRLCNSYEIIQKVLISIHCVEYLDLICTSFLTRVWKICMSNVTKITLSHLLPTGKVMAATMTFT